MATLLFTVADAFEISGRGCVLVPGLSPEPGIPTVHVGEAIRLEKPDGEVIETRIHGIEMLNYGPRRPEKIYAPISLPRPITKHDVPAGTRVFLLVESDIGRRGDA